MKNLFDADQDRNEKCVARKQHKKLKNYYLGLIITIASTACQKQDVSAPVPELNTSIEELNIIRSHGQDEKLVIEPDGQFASKSHHQLIKQTVWELAQARAAATK